MGCEPHHSFKRKNKANGIVIKKSKEDKSKEMKLIKKPIKVWKLIISIEKIRDGSTYQKMQLNCFSLKSILLFKKLII